MYVHIGEETLIRTRDIVAILDQVSMEASENHLNFMNLQRDQLIDLTSGSWKSMIITSDKIYLSPLASSTLKKRLN